MSCTHQRTYEVDDGHQDWDGDWVPNLKWRTVNTTRDLDTHHYQCTQCGQVFTYHGSLFTPVAGDRP